MLISKSADNSSASTGRPDTIVRVIRRICLLNEQGQSAEAARLETTELAAALEAARAAGGAAAVAQEILTEIYVVEKDRSATAVALSDLIVAQLQPYLFAGGPPGRPAFSLAANPAPPATTAAGPTPGGSPAIPDLLDAMLAHDRSAAHRRTTSTPAGTGPTDKQTSHHHDNRHH